MKNKKTTEDLIHEITYDYESMTPADRKAVNKAFKVRFIEENEDNPNYLKNPQKFIDDNFRGKQMYIADRLKKEYGIDITPRQAKAVVIDEKGLVKKRAEEYEDRVQKAMKASAGKILMQATDSDHLYYSTLGVVTHVNGAGLVTTDGEGNQYVHAAKSVMEMLKNHSMILVDHAG